ncbi:YfiT family bacillithiol transferase [Rummeliibacillus sp. NPDC094406]|uniref:YfiT family bacillithiol transferase n=1 Tax=Rummeliibacillus sp. NPDC094406 TaxID=3364511 RepID=UPI00381F5CDC
MINERYPIGQFEYDDIISKEQVAQWIEEIHSLPQQLKEVVKDLREEDLNRTYCPNSWTVSQLVHHLADSHMNGYIRMKLAITEEMPTIKPYEEAEWAELPDYSLPMTVSLHLIESLHERWAYLLQKLTEEQLKRTFLHPVSSITTVEKSIGIYAWHGKHHLAHIQNALA